MPRRLPTRPEAVLFDLDGTLLDTAPDLIDATNAVRLEDGLDALPEALLRHRVSHGSPALVRAAFDLEPGQERFSHYQQRLLTHYRAGIARRTQLFVGMEAVLALLKQSAIPWGIVTNKPAWLTDPLLAQLRLGEGCAISADTTTHSKPHPAPMLYACKVLCVEPHRCWYVGDAERDIQAGRAVEMLTLLAGWGYLSAEDDPSAWGADLQLERVGELHTLLRECLEHVV